MILDFIEVIYENWRKSGNIYLKGLITVATTLGLLFIILKIITYFYKILLGKYFIYYNNDSINCFILLIPKFFYPYECIT